MHLLNCVGVCFLGVCGQLDLSRIVILHNYGVRRPQPCVCVCVFVCLCVCACVCFVCGGACVRARLRTSTSFLALPPRLYPPRHLAPAPYLPPQAPGSTMTSSSTGTSHTYCRYAPLLPPRRGRFVGVRLLAAAGVACVKGPCFTPARRPEPYNQSGTSARCETPSPPSSSHPPSTTRHHLTHLPSVAPSPLLLPLPPRCPTSCR